MSIHKPSKSSKRIHSTADLARYVGLSRSTISRVLNEQPGLRPETVQLVRKAMEETGFTVNAHALHLRCKRMALVGVCMENFATSTVVAKLALLVFIGHFKQEELQQRLSELKRIGTPHLVVDHLGLKDTHMVSLNRVQAMRHVTELFIRQGHRNFGLLGISGPYQTVIDRMTGIREGLAAHKLDITQCTVSLDYLHPRGDHFEHGQVLARSFATLPKRPTAFIAVNDETAIGAMLEFQALGLQVPNDLSIVGFNNQKICLMAKPSLSSVDQQVDKIMEAAVESILQQLEGPTPKKPIIKLIEGVFISRGSTKAREAK